MSSNDPLDTVPIFLRKTYHMIDTCDPRIATWSDDGMYFVVKDADKFAMQILPQFFKHNKFSSFVRQLNFYGFRKLKPESLRVPDPHDVEAKYSKFKHDKFQRGREYLLADIRKSNQSDAATKHEVETLRNQVSALRAELFSEIHKSTKAAAASKQEVDRLHNEVKELRTALSETSTKFSRLYSYVHSMMNNQSVIYDVYVSPDKTTTTTAATSSLPTKRKQSFDETGPATVIKKHKVMPVATEFSTYPQKPQKSVSPTKQLLPAPVVEPLMPVTSMSSSFPISVHDSTRKEGNTQHLSKAKQDLANDDVVVPSPVTSLSLPPPAVVSPVAVSDSSEAGESQNEHEHDHDLNPNPEQLTDEFDDFALGDTAAASLTANPSNNDNDEEEKRLLTSFDDMLTPLTSSDQEMLTSLFHDDI